MTPGLLRRVVQALAVTAISVCAVGGFLGLRAVIWRQEYLASAMLQSGALVGAGLAGALGAIYVLFGARVVNLDWFSLEFGALLGALLYGGYNAITPLSALSASEIPLWRALQGGIDGVWIGALLGLATLLISGRPLRVTRADLTRYLLLYVTVILLAALILTVETVVHLPDAVGLVIALPLLLVLRLLVGWLDRRADSSRGYGYEDGG